MVMRCLRSTRRYLSARVQFSSLLNCALIDIPPTVSLSILCGAYERGLPKCTGVSRAVPIGEAELRVDRFEMLGELLHALKEGDLCRVEPPVPKELS